MAQEIQISSAPLVTIRISSSIASFESERRFDRGLTIAALKGKLELLTGATPANMKLEVYDQKDNLVCRINDDDSLLGSYHIDDGMRLHVIDNVSQVGEFEDTSKVEKFELTADQYEAKSDSVRAFKQRMKLGRFKEVDPEEAKEKELEKEQKAAEEKAMAEAIKVDDRCEVKVPGNPTRRGTVKYSGEVHFKPGYWIGVQYDEPLGKNDGSVQGKRYFECQPKYGGFVKPNQVTVGDFPEEDLDLDDDDEI